MTERSEWNILLHAAIEDSDPKIIVDKEGNLLELNDEAAQLFGCKNQRFFGKNLLKLDVLSPKSRIIFARNIRETSCPSFDLELTKEKEGSRWFEAQAKRTILNKEMIVILSFHEVTERKRTEARLRESEQLYKCFCEESQVLMISTDLKGNITFVNRCAETFGLDRIKMIGENILSLVNEEDQSKLVFGHIGAIAGKTVEEEIRLMTPRGAIEVNYLMSPLKKEGQIVGCRVIIQDITKRKELERKLQEYSLHLKEMVDEKTEELRKSEASLKKYSLHLEELVEERTRKLGELKRMAAIGELAGMVGHDLRNPLAAIKNATFLLKKKQASFVGETGRQMLTVIDSSIEHADKIINDLLDYSREINLELKEHSPNSIMKQVLQQLVIPKKIRFSSKMANEPKLLVDIDKIDRVFINIIKNAIDAMPNGGKLKITSSLKGENIEFMIADTGIGIPLDVMGKIFNPLFTTKAQGMGFGLAICKRIVEAHGGKIYVESIVNKGTTFTVSLPLLQKTLSTLAYEEAPIISKS